MSHNSSNLKTYCCDRTISQFGAMVVSLSVWRMWAFANDTSELPLCEMHLHATISTSALNRATEYRAVGVHWIKSPPSPRTLGARAPRTGYRAYPSPEGKSISVLLSIGGRRHDTRCRAGRPRGRWEATAPRRTPRSSTYLTVALCGPLIPLAASHFRAAFVPRYYYEHSMIWTSEIILFW